MAPPKITRFDTEALWRARNGDDWFTDMDHGSGFSGLGSALSQYNNGSDFRHVVPDGKAAVVAQVSMHMESVNDNFTVEFGCTSDAGGTGTFTPKTQHYHIDTPAAQSQLEPNLMTLIPPVYVKDTEGAAVTARVVGNDAGAILSLGMRGWDEEY